MIRVSTWCGAYALIDDTQFEVGTDKVHCPNHEAPCRTEKRESMRIETSMGLCSECDSNPDLYEGLCFCSIPMKVCAACLNGPMDEHESDLCGRCMQLPERYFDAVLVHTIGRGVPKEWLDRVRPSYIQSALWNLEAMKEIAAWWQETMARARSSRAR